MPAQPRQQRLHFGEESSLWDRLPEETRRQTLALLEQMLEEIRVDRNGEEGGHERENHLGAS